MNKTQWTVNDIPPQTGKLAVVTGANSGIGGHTALELTRAGSEVILAARSEAKGRDAVERIRRELPSANVHFETLDLASLRSVRAFAGMVNREAKLDRCGHRCHGDLALSSVLSLLHGSWSLSSDL